MLSKAQTEYLIFKLLVDTKHIDKRMSDFELANDLSTTMARVRALRFRYEQEEVKARKGKVDTLLDKNSILFEEAKESGKIRVVVRSRYLRDFLVAELQRLNAIALTEMTPSTFLVTPKDLVTALVIVASKPDKRDWVETEEGAAAVQEFLDNLSDSSRTGKIRARASAVLRGAGATTEAVGALASIAAALQSLLNSKAAG